MAKPAQSGQFYKDWKNQTESTVVYSLMYDDIPDHAVIGDFSMFEYV